MLKAKKLHKYYHSFAHKPLHVINDTSLEIPETGIIAVVGASGAGKTTLINTISGLDSFKSGTIEFDDVKMEHYRTSVADKMRMKNYGFIFQNYYLLEKETVYENVKVALDAYDISESEKKKRVNYVLEQLGIAKYTNKVVTSLSGGEQQRVSIARALVKSPRIIFADEPTGSLDEITTFNVLNIFKRISKNCAVFIVTHEKDIISYYADYIIEIDNGIIVKESMPVLGEDKTLSVDQNVYLDELEHRKHENLDNVTVDFYSDGSSTAEADVKVAVKNGKIYLESSKDIVVLNEKSENHLLKGKKRAIQDYVNADFNYELSSLTYNRNNIGVREAFKKGYKNFKTKGKIRTILKVVCLALSVILVGVVEGFSAINSTDLSSKLLNAEGNVYVDVKPDSLGIRSSQLREVQAAVNETIINSDLPGTLLFESTDKLRYKYQGFAQVQNQLFVLPSHNMKVIETLKQKDLVYGSMPKNGYEVVVDEYVLSGLIKDTVLKNIVNDYSYFIGKTLQSDSYYYSLVISGVCRTRSPAIYGYEGLTFARLNSYSQARVIDIDYAKTIYPELAEYSLEKGHCLRNVFVRSTSLSNMMVDNYFNDLPYDYIINKADFNTLKVRFAVNGVVTYIQTDGSKEMIASYKELLDQVREEYRQKEIIVKIDLIYPYEEQKNKALNTLNNILSSVIIVAYVLAGLALILVILSTYLSMLSQISDIAVYRSLGYSRSFLGLIYLIELGLSAFIYTFFGGLLTYFVLFIADIVPIINYSISTPFALALLVMLILALSIIIIGIIPVALVLRLTPASIYARYNRRINNE